MPAKARDEMDVVTCTNMHLTLHEVKCLINFNIVAKEGGVQLGRAVFFPTDMKKDMTFVAFMEHCVHHTLSHYPLPATDQNTLCRT